MGGGFHNMTSQLRESHSSLELDGSQIGKLSL